MRSEKQEWMFTQAKSQLSQVVNNALSGAIQRIQRRQDAVVVISEEKYEALKALSEPKQEPCLKQHLLNSSIDLSDVDLERDKEDVMREVDFS